MTVFLTIGAIGIILLLVALLIGDVLDGVLDSLGVSTEAVAGFLSALGFVGALTLSLTDAAALSWVVGAGAGVGLAVAATAGSRWLHREDHTGSVRTSDLVERRGTVLSDIPAGGLGVVSLSVSGHLTRVNARSAAPLSAGTEVVIVEVLSPTSVQVVPLFTS